MGQYMPRHSPRLRSSLGAQNLFCSGGRETFVGRREGSAPRAAQGNGNYREEGVKCFLDVLRLLRLPAGCADIHVGNERLRSSICRINSAPPVNTPREMNPLPSQLRDPRGNTLNSHTRQLLFPLPLTGSRRHQHLLKSLRHASRIEVFQRVGLSLHTQ